MQMAAGLSITIVSIDLFYDLILFNKLAVLLTYVQSRDDPYTNQPKANECSINYELVKRVLKCIGNLCPAGLCKTASKGIYPSLGFKFCIFACRDIHHLFGWIIHRIAQCFNKHDCSKCCPKQRHRRWCSKEKEA